MLFAPNGFMGEYFLSLKFAIGGAGGIPFYVSSWPKHEFLCREQCSFNSLFFLFAPKELDEMEEKLEDIKELSE